MTRDEKASWPPRIQDLARLAGLTGRQAAAFALLVAVVNIPVLHRFLFRPHPPVLGSVPFEDTFDRAEPGPTYRSAGPPPRIVDGSLVVAGVRNNPTWLDVSLPRNVRIEMDARCDSTEGDIKLELFADGWIHESGYLLYFGGWSNTVSVIAKLDENAPAATHGGTMGSSSPFRVERRDLRVEPHRTYHFVIERVGNRLRWIIDNAIFLELDDPAPLEGPWHDRLGFSSWDSLVSFDNLKISPL